MTDFRASKDQQITIESRDFQDELMEGSKAPSSNQVRSRQSQEKQTRSILYQKTEARKRQRVSRISFFH